MPLPADAPEVVEDGVTFVDNALKKARSAAEATGLPAVADDSGLCVDALNGMPGVLSARWAGSHGDDAANLRLVLDQLSAVPDELRGAAFVCAAALALPTGEEHVVEGRLVGSLVREPRGERWLRLRPGVRARGRHPDDRRDVGSGEERDLAPGQRVPRPGAGDPHHGAARLSRLGAGRPGGGPTPR